jgi:superfamily II DNA or RNA helicase
MQHILVDHHAGQLERVLKERWHVYEERPLRDVGELFLVARKVVNSDPSRLLEVEKLVRKHDKLIIFYNFNYELDQLRMLSTWFDIPVAEWNGHKHEEIPKTDRWIYLVQYTAGAEGWNCIETNAMVFYSLNYSYKLFEQAQGRIDRRNTPYTDLQYYLLKSDSFIDKAIMRALTHKKSFNERKYWKNLSLAA